MKSENHNSNNRSIESQNKKHTHKNKQTNKIKKTQAKEYNHTKKKHTIINVKKKEQTK